SVASADRHTEITRSPAGSDAVRGLLFLGECHRLPRFSRTVNRITLELDGTQLCGRYRMITVGNGDAGNRGVERGLEVPASTFDAPRLHATLTEADTGGPVDPEAQGFIREREACERLAGRGCEASSGKQQEKLESNAAPLYRAEKYSGYQCFSVTRRPRRGHGADRRCDSAPLPHSTPRASAVRTHAN